MDRLGIELLSVFGMPPVEFIFHAVLQDAARQ